MSLLYRSIFSAPRQELVREVRQAFVEWVESKGIEVPVPETGVAQGDGIEITALPALGGDLKAVRYVLREDSANERWTTTLTAIQDEDDPTVWVDLERVSGDPFGRPPIVAVPRLVEALLAPGDCCVGPTRLSVDPQLIDDDHAADVLLAELLDPTRRIPLIVMSRDRYTTTDGAMQRGRQVLKKVLGLAPVFVLEAESSSRLEAALGADLAVYGGAVRTYLPELTIPDRLPKRHPFIARTVLASQTASAASRIQRTLAQQAIAQRPPDVYRDQIAALPGFPHHQTPGADDEELVAELVTVEGERNELLVQVRDLQDEVEFAALQLEETESLLDAAQSRVRFLETRLRVAHDHSAFEPTPAPAIPETAESCADAIGLARQYLTGIVMGDTDYPASTLDTYAKSGSWAKKAWRVFRAMDDYAEAKERDDFAGDFLAYCTDSPLGLTIVPSTWVALKESESTDNNPRYRSARTFPVPAEVSEDEELYMCAHVKLEAGGRPAPRIHFYDDTAGPTGVVYIGYFGEHLPNDQTN